MGYKSKYLSKVIFFATVVFLTLTGITTLAQKFVTIKGQIGGDTKGYNEVYLYPEGDKPVTAVIQNGIFEIQIPCSKSITVPISLEYENATRVAGKAISCFMVLCEGPGVINITLPDISRGMHNAEVSGLSSAADMQEFTSMFEPMYLNTDKILKNKYGKEPLPGDAEYDAYQDDFKSITKKEISGIFEKFVKAHPGSFASAYVLSTIGGSMLEPVGLMKIYDILTKERQQSEEGKSIIAYLEGVEKSAIGKVVANFTLNDPEGKPVSLGDLKGKYVIIDFWASWCGPCKQSFPHLKEIYERYKGKNFEILSISIDKDKDSWIKELRQQKLPWVQVLDTKNIGKTNFVVDGVPTTYLINPDGKILINELGFNDDSPLERKLIEVMEGKVQTIGSTPSKIKSSKRKKGE